MIRSKWRQPSAMYRVMSQKFALTSIKVEEIDVIGVEAPVTEQSTEVECDDALSLSIWVFLVTLDSEALVAITFPVGSVIAGSHAKPKLEISI